MKGDGRFTPTEYANENGIEFTNALFSINNNFICPYNYETSNYLGLSGTVSGVTSMYAAVYVNNSVDPFYKSATVEEFSAASRSLSQLSVNMRGYDFNIGLNTVVCRIFDSTTNEVIAHGSLDVMRSYYNFCYAYYLPGNMANFSLRRFGSMTHSCRLQNAPAEWEEQEKYKRDKGAVYPYDGIILELPTDKPDRIASNTVLTVNLSSVESELDGPVRMMATPYWSARTGDTKTFDTNDNCKKATMPSAAGNRSAEYFVPKGGPTTFSVNLSAAYMRDNPPDGVVISLAPGEEAIVDVESYFTKAQQTFADFCMQPAPLIQPFAVFLDWSWFNPPDIELFEKYELYKDGELLITFTSPKVKKYTDFETNINEAHDYFLLAHFKSIPDMTIVFPESTASASAEVKDHKLQPRLKEFDTRPVIESPNIASPTQVKIDYETGVVTMIPNARFVGYGRVTHTWQTAGHLYLPTALKINLDANTTHAEYDITTTMKDTNEEITGFKQKTFVLNTANANFGGIRFE